MCMRERHCYLSDGRSTGSFLSKVSSGCLGQPRATCIPGEAIFHWITDKQEVFWGTYIKPCVLECSKLMREHMTNIKTAHAGGPWLTVLSPWNIYSSRQWCQGDWSAPKVIGNHKCSAPWAVSAGKRLQSSQRKEPGAKEKREYDKVLLCFRCPPVQYYDTLLLLLRKLKFKWCLSLFLCSWAYSRWQLATNIRGKCAATAVTCREISAVYSGLPVSYATGCLLTLPPLPLAVRAANLTLLL